MESYVIFLLVVAVILFIIVVAFIIVILVNNNNNNLTGCTSNANCPSGQECVINDGSNVGVCLTKKSPSGGKIKTPPKSTNVATVLGKTKAPLKTTSSVSRESHSGIDVNKLRKIPSISSLDLVPNNKKVTKIVIDNGEVDIGGKNSGDDDGSSLCHQEEDVFACKIRVNSVIDVCSFSNMTIFLLERGDIICETEETAPGSKVLQRNITNNEQFKRIFSFNGYLYALNYAGKLYTLSNNYLKLNKWDWTLVKWTPDGNIIHASTTLDNKFLLLQINHTGYLYDKAQPEALKIFADLRLRRVYGKNLDHYVDLDAKEQTALVYAGGGGGGAGGGAGSGKLYQNIYDAALNYNNELIIIRPENADGFIKIAIVDWTPYLIRR